MHRTPRVITLTSDFGWKDYHLALLKGHLLQQIPDARLVDISHEIENYNIVQAAFLFKHAWQAFPQGSIHIVSVNDFSDKQQGFLAFEYEGHYFIGPNNGLFSIVFNQQPAQCFQIELEETTHTFPLAKIYSHAAGHLAQDFPLGGLGKAIDHWTERFKPAGGYRPFSHPR